MPSDLAPAYSGNAEVNVNRPETCFLLIDGLEGPVQTVVPKSFAVRRFFLFGDRPFTIGSDGLSDTNGVINMSHLTVVLDTPSILPTLQQDCFSGRVFKTVSIQLYANLLKNNNKTLEITLTNARIALVTANYKPEESKGINAGSLFGAMTDTNVNKSLLLESAQKYPTKNALNDVVVKFAYDTIKVSVHKNEDTGEGRGVFSTEIDLHSNTVTAGA